MKQDTILDSIKDKKNVFYNIKVHLEKKKLAIMACPQHLGDLGSSINLGPHITYLNI